MNTYEQKQAARKQRYLEKAEKAREQANLLSGEAIEMMKAIPPGQPILTDHYSAKRHVKFLGKTDAKMRKALELEKLANQCERRANYVDDFRISDDDPDAIKKLNARIDELQAIEHKGSNTHANIRRLKQRVTNLEKKATFQTKRIQYEGFAVEQNVDENRIMFFFEGKPDEQTRSILKSNGFKWSPSRNAWVRQWTNAAIYSARLAVKELKEIIALKGGA